MRFCPFCFLFLLIGACANFSYPPEFQSRAIETPDFLIQTWVRETDISSPFIIYIEGDGRAFNSSNIPTNNPTPRGYFVRNMAIRDVRPNVAYVARPCQFLSGKKCEQKYWTSARFSPPVIDSMAYAVRDIVETRPVVLVGFSGGAMVAGLIAVRHPEINVRELITYGGNLNHVAWTDYHNLSPLLGSLNLADFRDAYMRYPSTHYVGENDTVIPPQLVLDFIDGQHDVIIIPNVGHDFK